MFKHLFATMNEVLDEIAEQYPHVAGSQKKQLDEQIVVLKTMSDEFIEDWLAFEEKLRSIPSDTTTASSKKAVKSTLPVAKTCVTASSASPPGMKPLSDLETSIKQSDQFRVAQGYYKLCMYDEAIGHFERLLQKEPDFQLGRAYLAMGQLRKGNIAEANHHFQLLAPLTDNPTMKAISYNVMGCIQYEKCNEDQAYEFFKKAYRNDPKVMSLDT
ncbi:tetratricopeptide repeat protein [Paenibacillus sp. KN14-4R]|uniref:tetratricopeptide repeat protein n=1 Tax=Paenibacillus sp. KN14-4R TaxID=3445773 RepID=UPI003F9F3F08